LKKLFSIKGTQGKQIVVLVFSECKSETSLTANVEQGKQSAHWRREKWQRAVCLTLKVLII